MEIMIPSFTYLSGLYWNELMDINELIGNTKIWAFLIHFLYIFVCSAPWITFLSTQFNLIWPKEWFFFFNSFNLTFRVGWSSNSDGFVKNFSCLHVLGLSLLLFSVSVRLSLCGQNDHEYLWTWIICFTAALVMCPHLNQSPMDSSDWLELSHVLKPAPLKLFALNGRMWLSKGK